MNERIWRLKYKLYHVWISFLLWLEDIFYWPGEWVNRHRRWIDDNYYHEYGSGKADTRYESK